MEPVVWQPVAGIVAIVFAVGLSTVGARAAMFWLKRSDRAPARRPEIEDDRLRHLEQAVDAIAVEVERISEAQRFSAKLLAGRDAGATASAAEQAERAPGGAPRPSATPKSD